jgi:hypothetical protein
MVLTQKLLIASMQGHQYWAKEIMLETLQSHLNDVKTKVRVDLP